MPLRRIVSLGVTIPAGGWSAHSELIRKIKMRISTPPSSQCAEKAQRLSQTIGKVHLGAPTENAPSARGVNDAAELLAGFNRAVLRREVLAGDFRQQLLKLIHAGLDAGTNVVRAGRDLALQGEDVGARHISDVDVVAGLLTTAVYRGGPAPGQVSTEDGHHPSLTVWVLPRPVDVGVAQSHVRDAVLQVVEIEVTLPGELRDPVWGEWVLRMILARGKGLLLPVDSPAGRGEDHPSHIVLYAVLEEANGAQHIYFCIEVRLSDRTPNIHLGCLMTQCLWRELLEYAETPGADVRLVEASPFRDV